MAATLYLGTEDGVVKLKESAGSWEAEHSFKGWPVMEVGVSASNPASVVAGTRGDGVWVSEDGGEHWRKPCYGRRGPGKVQCITRDPHNPQRLYAGCEPIDVFVSEDMGESWERLDSIWDHPWVSSVTYVMPTVEPHVRDITVDPGDPNTIYVALQVGYMLKSTDRGATWRLLDQKLDSDVHTIALDPTKTNTVLIATGGHDCRLGRSPGKALYRSEDGGDSWLPMATSFDQEYSIPLVLNPKQPNIVYSALAKGYERLWKRPSGAEGLVIRSEDGGHTWTGLQNGLAEFSQHMAVSLAIDESQPESVYAALSNGDLVGSRDGGDSWAKLGPNVPRVIDIECVRD